MPNPNFVLDRVQETTASTGTGALALAGPTQKNLDFAGSGVVDGGTFIGLIEHLTALEWELAVCQFNAGTPNTVTRVTLLKSSTGSTVAFSAGAKTVTLVAPSAPIVKPNRLIDSGTSTAMTALDYGIVVRKATAEPHTVTLPPNPVMFQEVFVGGAKPDPAGVITVQAGAGSGDGTINGQATHVLSLAFQGARYQFTGHGWVVVESSSTGIPDVDAAVKNAAEFEATWFPASVDAVYIRDKTAGKMGDTVVRRVTSFSDEAEAYFAAMHVEPGVRDKWRINFKIQRMKVIGYWALVDGMIFENAPTLQAALLNVKDPTRSMTIVGSLAFVANVGIAGNGSGYIDTGYNPGTDSGLGFSSNSWHLAVYNTTDVEEARAELGISTVWLTTHNSSSALFGLRANSSSTETFTREGFTNSAVGLTFASRATTTRTTLWKRGLYRTMTATASATLPDEKIQIFGTSASSSKSRKRQVFAAFGEAVDKNTQQPLDRILTEDAYWMEHDLLPSCVIQSADGSLWEYFDPDGLYHVDKLGAYGDGTPEGDGSADPGHDDQPYFQAGIDLAAVRNNTFVFYVGIPRGNANPAYKIADTVDFKGVRCGYDIRFEKFGGSVIHQTSPGGSIVAPTPFGAGKKLFDLDGNSGASGGKTNAYLTLENVTITRQEKHRHHPIAIYNPLASHTSIRFCEVRDIGNTGYWASEAFAVDSTGRFGLLCGYQPHYRAWDSTALGVTTDGSDVIEVSGGDFTAIDEGRPLYFKLGGTQRARSSGMAAGILEVQDSTHIKIDRPVPTGTASSAAQLGIDVCRATVTGKNVVFDGLQYDLDPVLDFKRFLYFKRGGPGGRVFISRIAEVTSGTTCTLEEAISVNTVDELVWFSPAFVICGWHQEAASIGYDGVPRAMNDCKFDQVQIENYMACAMLFEGGSDHGFSMFCDYAKLHGDGDFGTSMEAIVNSNVCGLHFGRVGFDFGIHGVDRGYIYQCGDRAVTVLPYSFLNGLTQGGYFAELDTDEDPRNVFVYGHVLGDRRWDLDAGLIKVNSSNLTLKHSRVIATGYVQGFNQLAERGVQLPQVIGAMRSAAPAILPNDSVVSFELPLSDTSDNSCILAVAAGTSATSGLFYVRTKSSAAGAVLSAGANCEVSGSVLTGTTGNVDKVTIGTDATTGLVYIENRTGAQLVVRWAVVG